MTRECKECGQTIVGRSDKKFCDDQCRSSYNNRYKQLTHAPLKQIDRILKKNHSILRKFNRQCDCIVTREQMLMSGFDFRYHTHSFNDNQKNIMYCYDLGYIINHDDGITLLAQ